MPSPRGFNYDSPDAFYDAGLFYDLDPSAKPKPKTKMASLNLSLSRKNAEELIALADKVSGKLVPASGTPPVPGMAAKDALLDTAAAAAKTANDTYENAKTALVNLRVLRDQASDALRTEHTAVAKAVESEARGDAAMLTASGYDLAAEATSSTAPPDKVLNLNVTASENDGQLDVQHDPVSGGRTYELQLTSVDPVTGPWVAQGANTSSRCTLTGLTSGQRVWLRVRAVGVNGPGAWSDPYTKIVP